jgi:hypothetical protein
VATVILISPRDGGTYGTQADGSLVPFTATGFVDVPGQVVSIYEDATSALLGSGVASSSPQPSGAYAGWYAWTVPVLSWSSAAGVFLPTMAGAGSLVFPTFAAEVPPPSMAGLGGMGEITYTSSATFSLPTMAGKGGMAVISITAVVGLPAMAGSGAMAAPTTEAGGGGPASFTDDFNRVNGALGANWETLLGSPTISGNAVSFGADGVARRVGTFANNQRSALRVNGATAVGPVVRASGSGATLTYYFADQSDDGEGGTGVAIGKVVNGGAIQWLGAGFDGLHNFVELSVSGTTLTLKVKVSAGDAWTTLGTRTDASIASGSPGVRGLAGTVADDAEGGDL